jgi:hypothetical protein
MLDGGKQDVLAKGWTLELVAAITARKASQAALLTDRDGCKHNILRPAILLAHPYEDRLAEECRQWTWRRRRRPLTGRGILERGYAMPDDTDRVLEAVAALRANGIEATPCGDGFEHWLVGDFILDDAALVRLRERHGPAEDGEEQRAVPATPPPWREITTDDYHPRTHRDDVGCAADVAAGRIIHRLLQDQLDGKHRLRLVLREAADLAGRDKKRQNPYWLWSYDLGVSTILSAAEVVIEMRSGKRHTVRMVRNPEDAKDPGSGWAEGVQGGVAPGPWLSRPSPTR